MERLLRCKDTKDMFLQVDVRLHAFSEGRKKKLIERSRMNECGACVCFSIDICCFSYSLRAFLEILSLAVEKHCFFPTRPSPSLFLYVWKNDGG